MVSVEHVPAVVVAVQHKPLLINATKDSLIVCP